MTLTLYVDMLSQPSRAVVAFCKLLNIPYNVKLVNLGKRENKTKEYLEKFPKGQAPAIDDDGFLLAESHAIMRYLSNKYDKTQLYPKDFQKRANVDRYLDAHHLFLRFPCSTYFQKTILRSVLMGQTLEETERLKLEKFVNNALKELDQIWLSKGSYLAGEELTIADLSSYCELYQIAFLPNFKLENYPNLNKWFNTINNLPIFKEINVVYDKFGKLVLSKL
eukprot:TRINITY_DN2249_c0_g1_i1.p1 TRINITY_DN2249_c0_g1~~TRINITY_DN2249_c0_g1_i1.p1  ORF type:complete len:222 (-),score=49.83 TRINITY_DN2249_c0_g1_i1:33-698(-)